MGSVYYQNVNGRMRSENRNGVRRDYATDALGSVTATIDSTGAVENTYRYKPYGATLAKTGSGTDPRYMWTGDTGSRTTNRRNAEQYNRRRHYGSPQAAWTSVDPLFDGLLLAGLSIARSGNSYDYVLGNPASLADPSGLLGEPSGGPAGKACFSGRIDLSEVLKNVNPIFKTLKPDLKFSKCISCYECPRDCGPQPVCPTASICEKVSGGFCLSLDPVKINWSDLIGITNGKKLFDQIASVVLGLGIGTLACAQPQKECKEKSKTLGVELCGSFCNIGVEGSACGRIYSETTCLGSKLNWDQKESVRFSNCGFLKLEICLQVFFEDCR